jgi:hypothetical protein
MIGRSSGKRAVCKAQEKAMPNRKFRLRAAARMLPVAVSMLTVQPAGAEKWPGDDAPPGGAIAAKVIGQSCSGALDKGEIAELEDYIARRRAEFMAGDSDQQHLARYLFPQLDRAYQSDYSDPSRCTADSTEMARDMLQRVRRIMGRKA